MRALMGRHPLATFFVLAIGVTWAVWVPRALVGIGVIQSDLVAGQPVTVCGT